MLVLVLPKWVAPNLPTKLALKPGLDWVVGCKPAGTPEFCCLTPTPRGANVPFRFVLPTLRPMTAMGVLPGNTMIVLALAALAAAAAMAATGIPPGDKRIVLTFKATAVAVATTFEGGEVGVCAMVRVAWRELGLDKLSKY